MSHLLQQSVPQQKWKQCHSTTEISKMKNMHTEAFLQHWSRDSNIENCPSVLRFRESLLRQEEDKQAGGGCTDEDSTVAMNRFQTCSHTTSTHVYNFMIDLTSAELIVDILCQGLHNISSQCPVHLQSCFAPEDVKQMKKLHIIEMKKFFTRLVEDRVPKDALDKCDMEKQHPEQSVPKTTTETKHFSGLNENHIYPDSKPRDDMTKEDITVDKFEHEETNDIETFEAELDDADVKDDILSEHKEVEDENKGEKEKRDEEILEVNRMTEDSSNLQSSTEDANAGASFNQPQPKTSSKSERSGTNSSDILLPSCFHISLMLIISLKYWL